MYVDAKTLGNQLEEDLSVSLLYMYKGQIYPLYGRGIGPLLNLYEAYGAMDGIVIADKVVGRAAAYIMAALHVKEVYAHLICEPARAYLKAKGIPLRYKSLTANIMNREGTGLCPFEQCLEGIEDEQEALAAIRQKAADLFGTRKIKKH